MLRRVLRANCNFDKFTKFVDGVDNIEIHSEESIDSILSEDMIDIIFYNRNRNIIIILFIFLS